MMEYEDIFEMLESVRTHKLEKGESIIPTSSVTGGYVGFATADTKGPATRWTISVAVLKASCEARTSDEAKEVLSRMRFYQDRRQLVEDLRAGTFMLEERPYTDIQLDEEESRVLREVLLNPPSPTVELVRVMSQSQPQNVNPFEGCDDSNTEDFLEMLGG